MRNEDGLRHCCWTPLSQDDAREGTKLKERTQGRQMEEKRKQKWEKEEEGSRASTLLLNAGRAVQSQAGETGPKTRLNAHISPPHPFKITLIAGVAVHKVFHGWDLTASDAKKSIFQCNLAQREPREDREIIQDSSRSFKVAAEVPAHSKRWQAARIWQVKS